MVTTTYSPAKASTIAVDLGPVDGPKAELWAQIAGTFLDQALHHGPLTVVLRDTHGVATVSVTSVAEVDAALASAQPGEAVPLDGVAAYVGVWRIDLPEAAAAGVLVVSEDHIPSEDPTTQSPAQPDFAQAVSTNHVPGEQYAR